MRATEFLIEDMSLEDIATLLKDRCAPFLSLKISKPLFRGVRPTPMSILSMHVTPVNRKPKDLSRPAHEYCDAWFLKKFGHRYRSNAVFATGDRGVAATYGKPSIIVPIGEFTACWSPDIEDLYNSVDVMLENISKDYSYLRDDPTILDDLLQNYRTGDVSNAVYSGNEVMIACDQYILLSSPNAGLGPFDYTEFINTL